MAALRKFTTTPQPHGLRVQIAAIRALGHLGDATAVPTLTDILAEGSNSPSVKGGKSHEFGWHAPPDFRAGAAAVALGRLGTPPASAASH